MRRSVQLLGVAIWAGLLAGCVERRYVIESDPPGALVLRNGQPIGATPADDHFVYSGNYHFTLIKEGYETLQVDQKVASPWYEVYPLDFVSEALYPGHLEDVQRFKYQLQPLQTPNPNEILQKAGALRSQGQGIGPPVPPPLPVPVPNGPPVSLPPGPPPPTPGLFPQS